MLDLTVRRLKFAYLRKTCEMFARLILTASRSSIEDEVKSVKTNLNAVIDFFFCLRFYSIAVERKIFNK